ncbi:MAG: caspase family protein [Planctomycetota bacterium]|nr:caspase family protein [Planctomycetota bacterium]
MKRLLASVSILALTAFARAQGPVPSAAPPAPRAARALLVGCTQYPYLEQAGVAPGSNTISLRGPANDVELFARTLRDVYAVPAASMTLLFGWPDDEKARPTKANIVRAFQKLAADAKAGDWIVIFLAGHGSQQPSSAASLDDEADGLDEIFLPADVRPAPDGQKVPNALVDDEIAQYVAAIQRKGSEVWLVVDACHSGTLLRGGDWVVRGLPADRLGVRGTAPRPAPAPVPATPGTAAPGATPAPAPAATDGVSAFYGAQSFGSAPEMELPEGGADARPQGLFTYLLVREMRRLGASATYSELAQRVIAAYQAFPCHLTVPMAQGDLDRVVGGGGRVAEPPLLLEIVNGSPRLNQGILQGVDVGLQLEAVADGAAPDARALAVLEVVAASLYDAECAVRSGALPADATSLRARITARPLGEFQLTLAVVSPRDEPLGIDALPQPVRDFLKSETSKFRVTADRREADWRIVVDGDHLHLRAADHVGAPDLLDVPTAKLALTLGKIRKVHNLRRLCGLFPPPDSTLAVWLERRARGSTRVERLDAGDVLRPGDEVRVMLKKSGAGIYDVTVHFLDANYGIRCLFPPAGGSARLEPKADAALELVPWTGVIDDSLGVESVWVLAVPRGPSDPVRSVAEFAQDPTTTRGLAEEKAARGVLEELMAGTLTRGLAVADSSAPSAGSIFQVPLVTVWPELGPPAWKSAEPPRAEAPCPFLAGLPVAFDPGTCFEFAASPATGARDDVLLLGDASGPRAVLFDFSAPAAVRPARPADFDPEAAFLFLPDGRRLALYDRRDRGSFDLCLLDADGDGNAESRWTRTDAEWILQEGVRMPWLSQAHLATSVIGNNMTKLATARLSFLAARAQH